MSAIFQDITFTWHDQDYIVQADNVLKLIAQIEELISIPELAAMFGEDGNLKFAVISEVYATALKYAGAKDASAEEVYEALFIGGKPREVVIEALSVIMLMMTPTSVLKQQAGDVPYSSGTPKKTAKKRSSRRRTKQS